MVEVAQVCKYHRYACGYCIPVYRSYSAFTAGFRDRHELIGLEACAPDQTRRQYLDRQRIRLHWQAVTDPPYRMRMALRSSAPNRSVNAGRMTSGARSWRSPRWRLFPSQSPRPAHRQQRFFAARSGVDASQAHTDLTANHFGRRSRLRIAATSRPRRRSGVSPTFSAA